MARKKSYSSKLEMQNAAKTLLTNIRFASIDEPISSLVVTSSVSNEGKSTVVVNLAEAIASSGRSVLLVECDFRNRTLAGMLNVRARAGAYAVLSGEVRIDQAVASTKVANMYLLDVEPGIPNPIDIISSERFRRLTEVLKGRYDYVIYDTPPVGAFVDAAVLSTLTDATLLVVRENFTKRDDVRTAYAQLEKADAYVVGVVMNRCKTVGDEYSSYYGHGGDSGRTGTEPVSSAVPLDNARYASGASLSPARGRARHGK